MKIGIDARMYGFRQTGIGLYIKNLIEGVVAQDRENSYVVFLSPKGLKDFHLASERVKVVVSSCNWYSFCEQTAFLFQILRENVDLMHFPHFNIPIFYWKKFVVTIHDIIPLLYPGQKIGRSLFRRLCFKIVFKAAVLRSEKIIAVSESTKKDIVGKFGAPSKKIEVIYEGIPTIPNRSPADIVPQMPPGRYVLYTGVWREHKNLAGLVRAFTLLVKKYGMNVYLAIVGSPDEVYMEPKVLWESEGLGDRVFVYEHIPENQLAFLYESASVMAVPSFYEGFGFVGLEAMSFGVPVAASRVASLPEVLGDAAVFFDPKDPEEIANSIKSILDSEGLADDLREKGRIQSKKYDWQKTIKSTIALYNKAGGITKKDETGRRKK